jgi:hypothetical protein
MSTSRYLGVYPSKKRWVARTQIKYKTTHIGTYRREIDAALAYDIVVYGEFYIGESHLRPSNFGVPSVFLLDEYVFKRRRGYTLCQCVPALSLMRYEPPPICDRLEERPTKYVYKARGKWWCFYIKNNEKHFVGDYYTKEEASIEQQDAMLLSLLDD